MFCLEAKKNLAGIKEVASPNQNLGSSLVEVEDCGTQMSAEKNKEPPSRKKSRRHALYKEPLTISEPLDCGQFIVSNTTESYYIPINVTFLDTVDFTEWDPIFRITTLVF